MSILQTYLKACQSVKEEYHQPTPLPLLEGEIPKDLNGHLYRNGAGRLVNYGVQYDHLFDGDGMVMHFHFQNGEVFYQNRFVETQEFLKEKQAQKMLYRSFGTNIPGGFWKNVLRMQFKNAANTNLVYHGGKLLALWEGGMPHLIHPETLETKGRYDYEGLLKNRFSWLDHKIAPELPFSAHPKLHLESGDLYNFGTAAGVKNRLVIYKVQPDEQALPMKGVPFVHDFILTESKRKIFFLTSVSFDLFRTFLGFKTPVASISPKRNQPTEILIQDGDHTQKLYTDYGFVFHHVGGYDVDENTIVVDSLRMEDFPDADMMKRTIQGETFESFQPYLTRFTLDLKHQEVITEKLSNYPMELPTIHPEKVGHKYRYAWAIGSPADSQKNLLHGITKYDFDKRQTYLQNFEPHLPGEPFFVPKPHAQKEDEGWLLSLLFDSEKVMTKLLIMDAQNLKVLASLQLPHNVPLGFHGTWVKRY